MLYSHNSKLIHTNNKIQYILLIMINYNTVDKNIRFHL